MPTLLEYINQLQQEHRYRIKMAFQPSDRQLETLERHLKKYDALEVGRPEKLMLQAQPMDFSQLGGHEIVIVDVVTRLPVSPPVLAAELRSLLGVSDDILKVFGRAEPVQQQIEADTDKNTQAKLGTDYATTEANATDAQSVTGDKYNQQMTKAARQSRSGDTESVGQITTGPDYDGPTDGNKSPIGSTSNNKPIPGKEKK